jgi:lysophospholipid acyltransferase (LPLAT)-like uncharacterized protein
MTGYILLAAYTQRWRIEGMDNLRLLTGDAPMIVAFWHEALPIMPILLLRARRAGMRRPAVVLASRHQDGQLIGNIMRCFGLGLVSGSSSKGGAAGLRGLARALSDGHHVALTPDGPRGPRRVAAPGVAQLAALSGMPILPCGVHASRAKPLNTWDRMRLTLPFGRAVLVCGAPITVPRDGWQTALPEIEAAMNAVQDKAAILV